MIRSVVRALDQESGEEVAIKVIKNKRSFLQQAGVEIKLLCEMAAFQSNEQLATELDDIQPELAFRALLTFVRPKGRLNEQLPVDWLEKK
ncbi:hypothetical protein X801_06180 [Opisthorchis viverrini]|uniref:Protein kinase domain-containing protein n=1 Tax=Opisthorchis viverrini TaxID=6198 RepID=A0A1S8WU72_OPIVI|nr:hypothetical protein X801_06180 [Opisthorchis viverrini]